MKKSNILLAAFVIALAATSVVNAEDIKVGFDYNMSGEIRFMDLLTTADPCQNSNIACEQPKPESVLSGDTGIPVKAEGATLNIHCSILDAIKYCENNNRGFICNNLKKLLLYGTETEKSEFMRSQKYVFPKRFSSLREVVFSAEVPVNKGMFVQVCKKENCRMEQVCGFKEKCDIANTVLCGASFAAVSALLPPAAFIVNVISGAGTSYVCSHLSGEISARYHKIDAKLPC